jgi:gliding motility-associated protein GldC
MLEPEGAIVKRADSPGLCYHPRMEREIKLNVQLDDNQVPERIQWQATDSPTGEPQGCDAFLLSLWNSQQKSTLRIDLWTKDMQVDHMNAFFFQTLMTLAETYERATHNHEVADGLRRFCEELAATVPMPPKDPPDPPS